MRLLAYNRKTGNKLIQRTVNLPFYNSGKNHSDFLNKELDVKFEAAVIRNILRENNYTDVIIYGVFESKMNGLDLED